MDLENLLKSYINSNETRLKNQENSIKTLETQVAQLVNLLSKRIHEDLPSNIETKPMEEVSDITLRCDTELEKLMNKVRQEMEKRLWNHKREKSHMILSLK